MVIFFLLPKWDGQLFTCSFLKWKAEVYYAQISGLLTQIVKKICFQPNISFRAKGEEFDFTFPACLYACKSKVYRFPLKHNAESRKKTTIRISLLIEQQIHLQATIKASILLHQSQKTNWLFMDEFPRRTITMETPQRWRHCCFLWLLSPQKPL